VIHKAWDNDFKAHKGDWGEVSLRYQFTRVSTGPFTPVSKGNMDYEAYIKREMIEHFKKEENDYEGYIAPITSVRGCWPLPGVEVPECGRRPNDWDRWVRILQ
jgi:hypothetical protein